MKKYNVKLTKSYEYEIDIDENVWTDKQIKNWSKCFQNAETIEDIVEILACMKPNYLDGEFIEGFGIIEEEDDISIETIEDGDIDYVEVNEIE